MPDLQRRKAETSSKKVRKAGGKNETYRGCQPSAVAGKRRKPHLTLQDRFAAAEWNRVCLHRCNSLKGEVGVSTAGHFCSKMLIPELNHDLLRSSGVSPDKVAKKIIKGACYMYARKGDEHFGLLVVFVERVRVSGDISRKVESLFGESDLGALYEAVTH